MSVQFAGNGSDSNRPKSTIFDAPNENVQEGGDHDLFSQMISTSAASARPTNLSDSDDILFQAIVDQCSPISIKREVTERVGVSDMDSLREKAKSSQGVSEDLFAEFESDFL